MTGLSIFVILIVQVVLGDLVKMRLDSERTKVVDGVVKKVKYCVGCNDPSRGGTFTFALPAKYGVSKFALTGEVVQGVPNHAESKPLLNSDDIYGRIVLFTRGVVSLVHKAQRAQQSGAIAVIVADDGRCDDDFTDCGARAGSVRSGGIASNDDEIEWKIIDIPLVIITQREAERLKQAMRVQELDVPPYGNQNVTLIERKEPHWDEL
jgi:hypothetical protein